MPTRDVEVPAIEEGAPESTDVVMAFAPTRTVFTKAELGGELLDLFATSPLLVVVSRSATLPREGFTVTLTFDGEPPSAAEAVSRMPGDPGGYVPLGRPPLVEGDEGQKAWRDALQAWTETVVEKRKRLRREAIDTYADPERRWLKYFYELDVATNTALLVKNAEQPFVKRKAGVEKALEVRLLSRLGASFDAGSAPPTVIDELSCLQLGLVRSHFPATPETVRAADGIDLDDIQEAFFAFASGKLRLGDDSPNARPDSGWFFFFAEFAILATETDELPAADRSAWAGLLPALVHAQELYPLAFPPYCPRGDGESPWIVPEHLRHFGHFTPQPGAPDAAGVRRLAFARLRARTFSTELVHLVERHTTNARAAFPNLGGTDTPCKMMPPHPAERLMPDPRDLGALLTELSTLLSQNQVAALDRKYMIIDGATLTVAQQGAVEPPNTLNPGTGEVKVGPMILVYDVGAQTGWYRTPIKAVMIKDRDVTVVGEENGRPMVWDLTPETVRAYLVVVPA